VRMSDVTMRQHERHFISATRERQPAVHSAVVTAGAAAARASWRWGTTPGVTALGRNAASWANFGWKPKEKPSRLLQELGLT
jgi:hypothetical protein